MTIMFHFKAFNFILFAVSTLIFLSFSFCHGDINLSPGWQCSEADNSTSSNSFQTNLNKLLSSLSANVPLQNGFYKATAGQDSDKIYCLVQCRGDISANDCANCTKESIKIALRDCSKSKMVAVWFRWCFLRYSNEKFFGVWEGSSMAISNDTFEDPSVISKGIAFMGGLASTAPNQPLMFQTSVLDVGQSGQRYGMAQCTRDMSRSECGKCLDGQLVSFGSTVEDKRGWELYGLSCSMWYHDFQFYSNITTVASAVPGLPLEVPSALSLKPPMDGVPTRQNAGSSNFGIGEAQNEIKVG
ncbi:hypothetical protein F0562_014135 [Nyssa sinensis]|uniref:Gnk2-homologous domain-containing protein n=1 Tax=Nyssa sinensis TaxID=561372 RepID=A0A5J4ZMS6_9ASTE|nr:hypothetical protein F0562_014135 [Nyssa sinensis]